MIRALEILTGGSARREQYYLVERLYNLYHLLRGGRGSARRVEELDDFMESFYSISELVAIAGPETEAVLEPLRRRNT